MHLGICAQRLVDVRTGVARYLANLLREWRSVHLPFDRVTLFTPRRLPDFAEYQQIHGGTRLPRALWEHLWIPWQARRLGVDLLFSPGYVLPLAYRGKSVVAIHDVMQEVIPEDFPRSSRYRHAPLYRLSARRANHIVACSDESNRDIQRFYGIPAARVTTIPLAADPRFAVQPAAGDSALAQRYGLGDSPFILFVGKFSRRRNLPALIAAFAQLGGATRLPHRLVLVGVNHLGLPIEQIVAQHNLGGRVVHLASVPDDDLAGLYRLADLFVYPSEIEGFGLPLLEAMASGTPVITLRRPVLQEVAGDAALYAANGNADDLYIALATMLRNPGLRQHFRECGLARVRNFTWATTADRTLAILSNTYKETA